MRCASCRTTQWRTSWFAVASGHISVIGTRVCIGNLTVLAAVQVASPSGRAVFELRGLPDNTTVDLKVCGPIASGGTMSIYRDGAFLWCATRNVI